MKISSSAHYGLKVPKTAKNSSELFSTSLVTKTYDPAPKSLLTPSVLTEDSQKSAERKKIKTFQDFISNCDHLIKDVNSLSGNIEQSLSERTKKISKTFKERSPEIRDKFYFDGLKRIEEKIKSRSVSQKKDELRVLKTLIEPSRYDSFGNFITLEDLNTQAGIEFLAENKREFGGKLNWTMDSRVDEKIKEMGKERSKKKKKKRIGKGKGAKKKGNGGGSGAEESPKKLMMHRHSMPDLVGKDGVRLPRIERKGKLPILDQATMQVVRAKAQANRFFADNKMICDGLRTKRRRTYIN